MGFVQLKMQSSSDLTVRRLSVLFGAALSTESIIWAHGARLRARFSIPHKFGTSET